MTQTVIVLMPILVLLFLLVLMGLFVIGLAALIVFLVRKNKMNNMDTQPPLE